MHLSSFFLSFFSVFLHVRAGGLVLGCAGSRRPRAAGSLPAAVCRLCCVSHMHMYVSSPTHTRLHRLHLPCTCPQDARVLLLLRPSSPPPTHTCPASALQDARVLLLLRPSSPTHTHLPCPAPALQDARVLLRRQPAGPVLRPLRAPERPPEKGERREGGRGGSGARRAGLRCRQPWPLWFTQ